MIPTFSLCNAASLQQKLILLYNKTLTGSFLQPFCSFFRALLSIVVFIHNGCADFWVDALRFSTRHTNTTACAGWGTKYASSLLARHWWLHQSGFLNYLAIIKVRFLCCFGSGCTIAHSPTNVFRPSSTRNLITSLDFMGPVLQLQTGGTAEA